MCRDAEGGSVARHQWPSDSTRSRPLAAASRPGLLFKRISDRNAYYWLHSCNAFRAQFWLAPTQASETHKKSYYLIDNSF